MKKPHKPYEKFPKEQVRSAIRSGIVQAQEQVAAPILRQVKWKRKAIYALGSAAIVFGLLVGSSYYSPALASSLSQLPIIGSIFGKSDLIGLQRAQKNGLTSEFGETQTVNGISVTLNEILYDQNNISIGIIMESDQELDENYFGSGMHFTINGKSSGSSGTYGEQIISPTTRTAIQEINVTDTMPNEFELGLTLYGENGERWHFTAPVEKINGISTIPIQHTQNIDGLHLTVTEMSLSETGVSISYESVENLTDFDKSRGGLVDFRIVDQDGNEITSLSGGATGELVKDKIAYTSRKHFDPIDSHVTELTITPYLVIPTSGGGVEFDEYGNEKVLEYDPDSIQPIDFTSFKVKIPR